MAEVEVARDGSVQTITLNRPDKLNAFNLAVHEGLRAALEEARDPAVRAVVITGAGRGFSAGQDLTAFGEAGDVAAMLRATYHVNILAIRALEKPVIAAVNGVFRHGKVTGSPMGEPSHAYYAEWEFADEQAFQSAIRSDEFTATGKDAFRRGFPQPTVEFLELA